MTTLTKNAPRTRLTHGHRFRDPVAAATRIFAGSMVALNGSGYAIKAVTSMIEPIMIVVMGSVVGFIAMAIILPIFKMSSLVSGH